MPYTFQPGSMYRMPTHFGPRTGPRQGPDGGTFANVDTPKNTTVSVSFLTDADALEAMLPECFTRDGDPVVTVFAKYMTQIEWLAGRGYNVLGVSFPAAFAGAEDQVCGPFLTVLWENLTDPILTGREELGFAKIYCELPEPTVLRGAWHCTAAWLGFKFLDLRVTDLREPDPGTTPPPTTARCISNTSPKPATGARPTSPTRSSPRPPAQTKEYWNTGAARAVSNSTAPPGRTCPRNTTSSTPSPLYPSWNTATPASPNPSAPRI